MWAFPREAACRQIKNHGFYQEDEKGRAFYQYGGDFEDINHWSNFSMDGYCLSDGTPKPSLRDSKNVLCPCYVTLEDGKIRLMNTNNFHSLVYISGWNGKFARIIMYWKKVRCNFRPSSLMKSTDLPLSTAFPGQTPGASYYVNLHFYEETADHTVRELGVKQVCLGSVAKAPWSGPAPAPALTSKTSTSGYVRSAQEFPPSHQSAQVHMSGTDVTVQSTRFCVKLTKGLLSYYEKDGKVLLDTPMKLNFYRAPIDNDGIVGWSLRWIRDWNNVFLKHFTFFAEAVELKKNPVTGKALPTARYAGFFIALKYHIYENGLVVVEYEGEPYGKLPKVLPRIGVCFEMSDSYTDVTWYGRGPEENYCDRKAHCPVGLYHLPVSKMNFQYDAPQECGTRTDTRFVSLSGADAGFSVIGMDNFAFSCHDFTLKNLEESRPRNELEKEDRKYLYIDYKMRGLGSHSCGPNPEECYELRPHRFRFAFGICGEQDEDALLQLVRNDFGVHTEALSEEYSFDTRWKPAGVIECNINRD